MSRALSVFATAVLAAGAIQPVTAHAATTSAAAAATSVTKTAAAPAPRPMTLAERHAQVSSRLDGLSPVIATARDHLVTKAPSAPHAPVRLATKPWLTHSATGKAAASPAAVPPPPSNVVADSFVYPGDITLAVDSELPSGTTASAIEGFYVLVYNSAGTLVYSQDIPESTNPTTYNGQESGGYCYGWWPPSKYPANWCFWSMANAPGGALADGQTYFAQVLFESTTGDWSSTGTYSNNVTVFYTPDIPGAEAGICTCYAQNNQGDPVNTATGAFDQEVTDAKLTGAGTPFALTRSYRSDLAASGQTGILGRGWSTPFDARIATGSGTATLTDSDGSQIIFTQNSNGTYSAPAGVRMTLAKTSSGWTVSELDHSSRTFNSSGQLLTAVDASGHGLTLGYASGKLSTVTDTAGRIVDFTLDSSGQATKVSLPDGRSVSYAYTGSELTSVTNLLGGVTAYTYDSSGRLLTIKDPLGVVTTTNTYDATTGRVSSQVDGTGAKTTFAWTASTQESDRTDPNGGVWSDIYANGVLQQSIDPFGNSVGYTYNQALQQTGITDRLGNTTTMTYDGAGDMLTRTGPAPLSYAESWTYDSSGDILSHTDGDGHKTSYTYDADGRLTSTTDADGGVAKEAYTSLGELASTTSPRGEVTTYGYDASGNRTSVTTAVGEKTTFTYDSAGRILTKTDPRGNISGATASAYTTTYTYNAADEYLTTKDPTGAVTTYAYDTDGRRASITDALGHVTATAYDGDGRVIKVTDPAGGATTRSYDGNGNLTSVTDALGNKTTYTYDKANQRLTQVSPRGNVSGATASAYTTTYAYDANGNETSITDPTGAVTKTSYDAINRPVVVTDPLGNATTTTYDADSYTTKVADALGDATTYTHDALGHVTGTTDPLGNTTNATYDADGNRVSQTTALGDKTTWTYDADERMATSVDPRGNVSGATASTYTTSYAYDAAGNQISVTDPLGDKSSVAYDGANQRTSSTDAVGSTTGYTYDADGEITAVTAPDGGVTKYAYDNLGDLTTRTDANNDATSYAYNAGQQLTSVTDPLGNAQHYAYDADGNAATVTDARGQTTTQTFDALDQLTKDVYSDGTPSVSYAYNGNGQVTSITDATGTSAYGYDKAGRVISIGGFSYTYDAAGDILSRTYPDGEKTTYTYDKDEQQASQTADGATTSYAYDAAGNLTTTTLPSTTGYSETRGYDAAGRLISIGSVNGTPPNVQEMGNWQLTLDADGRPTTAINALPIKVPSQGNLLLDFTYDGNGRLATSCTGNTRTTGGCLSSAITTYSYDKVGDLLSKQNSAGTIGYTYNAADEMTESTTGSATTAYTYDADGNQTGAGSNSFTYSAANKLTGATVGGTTYAFTNDAEGDRVSTSVGGAVTQTQAWDLNNSLPQLATLSSGSGSSSALIGDYHYNPLGQIQSEHAASGAYYAGHDYLGSVIGLVDSTGVDQYSDSYDVFGNQTVDKLVATAPAEPFGYTGALEDQSIGGLVDMRARTYDPSTDQFTSRDPQPTKTGSPYVGAYVYADDGPTYLTDPSGRSSVWSWLGNEWDQFSSGFVEGAESPYKLVTGLYDAFNGENGGWTGFFDTYVPVRPAYRLYNIADMLRQEGCPQLADLYENAGNELASQIATLGIGGLTGWEADAAASDAAELGADTSGSADAFRGVAKGKAGWYPNGPLISLSRFKQILARAGFGDLWDQYDFEYVPNLRDNKGNQAEAVSPANGGGPILGANGKPIIRYSNFGLQSTKEAVITLFHEIYHQNSWSEFGVPGGEKAAEAYGQAMWEKYKNRF